MLCSVLTTIDLFQIPGFICAYALFPYTYFIQLLYAAFIQNHLEVLVYEPYLSYCLCDLQSQKETQHSSDLSETGQGETCRRVLCSGNHVDSHTQAQSETFHKKLLKSEIHLSMKYCNKTKTSENQHHHSPKYLSTVEYKCCVS